MSRPGQLWVAPGQQDFNVGGICLKGIASSPSQAPKGLSLSFFFLNRAGHCNKLGIIFPDYKDNMGSLWKKERKYRIA